jgi:hypothetical protein
VSINIDYLDQLYTEYFDSISRLHSLEAVTELPDDGYSDRVHDERITQAKKDISKARNRIYAYIENHSEKPKAVQPCG